MPEVTPFFKAPKQAKKGRRKATPTEVRDAVETRSGGWCEARIEGVCLGAAGQFHHKLRRSHGREDTPENLLHLCGQSATTGCHGHIHANPAESFARGWLIRGVS